MSSFVPGFIARDINIGLSSSYCIRLNCHPPFLVLFKTKKCHSSFLGLLYPKERASLFLGLIVHYMSSFVLSLTVNDTNVIVLFWSYFAREKCHCSTLILLYITNVIVSSWFYFIRPNIIDRPRSYLTRNKCPHSFLVLLYTKEMT